MSGSRGFDLSLRLRIFFRSLSLQASWNHQRMQNLGLLFSLLPWLQRLPDDPNRNRLFCRRYFEFFNTNPYLANFLIGGLVRLEDDRRAGRDVPLDLIATYRDSLGRTLASLGDQLFWLGLRPALIMASCLVALMGHALGSVLVILVFSVLQLAARWASLGWGYSLGRDILRWLRHPAWHHAIRAGKKIAMTLTGMVAGTYVAKVQDLSGVFAGDLVWVGVILGIGLPLLIRKRMPGEIMLLAATALALAAGFAI